MRVDNNNADNHVTRNSCVASNNWVYQVKLLGMVVKVGEVPEYVMYEVAMMARLSLSRNKFPQ